MALDTSDTTLLRIESGPRETDSDPKMHEEVIKSMLSSGEETLKTVKAEAATRLRLREQELKDEFTSRHKGLTDHLAEERQKIENLRRELAEEEEDLRLNQDVFNKGVKEWEETSASAREDNRRLADDYKALDKGWKDLEAKVAAQVAREKEFAAYDEAQREMVAEQLNHADHEIEAANHAKLEAEKRANALQQAHRGLLQEVKDLKVLLEALQKAQQHLADQADAAAAKNAQKTSADPNSASAKPSANTAAADPDAAAHAPPPPSDPQGTSQAGSPMHEDDEPSHLDTGSALDALLVDPANPPHLTEVDLGNLPSTARHIHHILDKVPPELVDLARKEHRSTLVLAPFLGNNDMMSLPTVIPAWAAYFKRYLGGEDVELVLGGPRAILALNVPPKIHSFHRNLRALIHSPLVAAFVYEIRDLEANPARNIAVYSSGSNAIQDTDQAKDRFLSIARECFKQDRAVKGAIKHIVGNQDFEPARQAILESFGVTFAERTERYGVRVANYILTLRLPPMDLNLYNTLLNAVHKCDIKQGLRYVFKRQNPPLDCRICFDIGHYAAACKWSELEDYLGPRHDTKWKDFMGQQAREERQTETVGQIREEQEETQGQRRARDGGPNRNRQGNDRARR
ncbi:hypothetical protein CYLTODRAFT_439579 [Cylindrobasidium torrendii FP15055 ss-10]|uniref:Uncharacterized protein n=1 Tax=Cylindrobasidium torrendii FP15055 ss-10 TaxID=1314674 RepID=A0A0D7BTT1_9AGAR|nr:hypothetical protein CYLTODRAFT_439579 [Cylindrobasidium torrendii FP15055 ss-10]